MAAVLTFKSNKRLMRILLYSGHQYPAITTVGSGRHPKQFPSASGFWIHDLLAKGLAELGHQVFYLLTRGVKAPLPPGVMQVSKPIHDADILHTIAYCDEDNIVGQWSDKPWLATCHLDVTTRGRERSRNTDNWIFVSRTLAKLHGSNRYVLNGIDPAAYAYSESKDGFFLFMSTMDWGNRKGLDVALSLAKTIGFKLIVAGTGTDYQHINSVAQMCREVGADYVGDVRGVFKAYLLAKATALLFPTKLNEAFGLGMIEALMSGTPVICSDKGACPEIISSDVGFVCSSEPEYISAVNRIKEISNRACREKALREYHYLRMARNYVAEYKKEISGIPVSV